MRLAISLSIAAVAAAAVAAAVLMPADKRALDVVILVVDTLRADRLAPYGNATNLTPFLNDLSARSNVARNAYAQAPWTNPSVASIFTSRFVSQHGVTTFSSVLSKEEETLAESLAAAGYATAAFSANGLIAKSFGFDQGFDVYKAELRLRDPDAPPPLQLSDRASELSGHAMKWLDSILQAGAQRPRFFLYMQFMETHTPYAPPKEMLERVRPGKPPLDLKRVNESALVAKVHPPDAQTLQDIEDAYDAAVLEIDAALRDLLSELGRRGVLDDALLVVTADHGDEFNEHGMVGHGHSLYEEALRVPLLVRTPRQQRGNSIDRLVSLIDVAPTVLELAGVPTPARFEGKSFARDLAPAGWRDVLARFAARWSDDRPDPVAYSERRRFSDDEPASAHVRAAVADAAKVIESENGARAFYDLTSDPGEQRPGELAGDARDVIARRLEEARKRAETATSDAEEREIDEQSREALRALGYAQ